MTLSRKTLYGLLVWFVATIFVIYAFCLNTAAAVFEESIQSSLGATRMNVSLAVGAFTAGFALMQIPAGYLLDKFNARYVVSGGVLLLALGNILISYTTHLNLFAAANFLQGMGGSFAFIAVAILIAQWFPPHVFPILFGLTQTLSCILSGLIHTVMADQLKTTTWNELYFKLGLFGLSVFVLTLLLVKSPPEHENLNPPTLKVSLLSVVTNKQIMLSAIAASTSFGVLLAYASFWYMSVQKFYAVQTNDAYLISTLIFAGIGIGTPLLGYISNKLKSRTLVLHITLVLGTMLLLIGIYLPRFEHYTWQIIEITSFLIGFMLSGSTLFYTVVSETATDLNRGVALSVTNTGVFLFNALMMFIPLLLISQASPTFFTHLWILPFMILFSILLLYFVKDTVQNVE